MSINIKLDLELQSGIKLISRGSKKTLQKWIFQVLLIDKSILILKWLIYQMSFCCMRIYRIANFTNSTILQLKISYKKLVINYLKKVIKLQHQPMKIQI